MTSIGNLRDPHGRDGGRFVREESSRPAMSARSTASLAAERRSCPTPGSYPVDCPSAAGFRIARRIQRCRPRVSADGASPEEGVRNRRRECCSVGQRQFCFWRSTCPPWVAPWAPRAPSPAEPRVWPRSTCPPGVAPWAPRAPSPAEPRVWPRSTCPPGVAPWAPRAPSPAEPRVWPRSTCPPGVAPWARRAPSPAEPRVRPRSRSCPGQPQQRGWGSSAERPAAPSEAAPLPRSPGARSPGATESGRPQLPGR